MLADSGTDFLRSVVLWISSVVNSNTDCNLEHIYVCMSVHTYRHKHSFTKFSAKHY